MLSIYTKQNAALVIWQDFWLYVCQAMTSDKPNATVL